MKEPTLFEYSLLILVCLGFAVVGLYLLANFNKLFKSSIRNEFLRKNLVAAVIIFLLSSAMSPLSGGFFYTLSKSGWLGALSMQLIATILNTVVVFNLTMLVAEHPHLKKLPFLQHKLMILATLIFATVLVNVPIVIYMYGIDSPYLKYSIISSVYLAGSIGLVYAAVNYLDIERKRKFDEKELELSRLRELKSKAELDALHSKVNPHFLYNALNSIADLSVTDGKKARKMTVALADLFRYSINYGQNNYSTLNDEVAMTEVYLQIEKVRFEDQLNYSVAVEPGNGNWLVPRFILQPLVENAVKHGLKATGKMTEIRLNAVQQNGSLLIVIADNGPDFPDDIVPGYGVKSVFDKLDLLFPGQYEIRFTNKPVKQVSLQIHKLMKNEPAV